MFTGLVTSSVFSDQERQASLTTLRLCLAILGRSSEDAVVLEASRFLFEEGRRSVVADMVGGLALQEVAQVVDARRSHPVCFSGLFFSGTMGLLETLLSFTEKAVEAKKAKNRVLVLEAAKLGRALMNPSAGLAENLGEGAREINGVTVTFCRAARDVVEAASAFVGAEDFRATAREHVLHLERAMQGAAMDIALGEIVAQRRLRRQRQVEQGLAA